MSSLLAPLPSSLSDHHFVGDLATLLERRKLKCGDAQSLDRFASELVSSDALRSDLFALCSAISHLSPEDLSADELLVLVARALSGPAVATDGAVEELPATVRSTFQEAYEQWSRCRFAVVETSAWPAASAAGMFNSSRRTGEASEEACEPAPRLPANGEPEDSLPTVQAALSMARRRSLQEMISEDPALEQAQVGQVQAEGDRLRVGVRLAVRGLVMGAYLAAIAGGFTAGCVYQSLHSGAVRPPRSEAVNVNGDAGRVARATVGAMDKSDATVTTPVALVRSAAAGTTNTARQSAVRTPVLPQARRLVLSRVEQRAIARYAGAGSSAAPLDVATEPLPAPAASDVLELTSGVSGLPHVPSTSVMAYAVSAPTPVYPADQPRGISGTVMVGVSISRQGNVTGVWAVSGPEALRAAAIQAVQAWRFRPYLIDGNPAEVTTTFGFFFNGR